MIKNLLFDFDGTLVDSGDLIYRNLVEYVRRENVPSLDYLRSLASHEVLSSLKITKMDLPRLIIKIRRDFKKNICRVPIVNGIADAIKSLDSQKRLIICTSNSMENVVQILKDNDLDWKFEMVVSMSTIFGKAACIKKTIARLGLEPSETVYIGDETRDIEAARKIGISSAAVTWGYNNKQILEAYRPDYVVNSPAELLALQ
jgi:phosphoglycolate phosphatase